MAFNINKLRFLLYPVVFFIFFALGFYLLFPKYILKENIENILINQLFKINKEGGTPLVKVKNACLWRLSGIGAHDVSILWPPIDDKPALNILLNDFYVRTGIFALLRGHKNISGKINAFAGRVYGNIYINKANFISKLKLNIKDLGLKQLPMSNILGGLVYMDLDATATDDMRRDGLGKISLSGKSLEIGPGNINIPSADFLGLVAIPQIKLGQLSANFSLEKGELISKNIAFTTGDIEGEANISINIGASLNTSKITGNGWFKIKPEFIASNNTIKMLFDLIPELKSAKAGNGKVAFNIKGMLKNPKFSLQNKI